MDRVIFKNGFTDEQGGILAFAVTLMTGPGAEYRLSFIKQLRERSEAGELAKETSIDRNQASCFRTGIMGGCHIQGRTDPQIEVLLRAASILKIRSWIELPKVEDYKADFDADENIPFDGDDA